MPSGRDLDLIDACADYNKAADHALAALKAALPAGREVGWWHGEQLRGGTVVEVLGYTFEFARVRVRSDVSGKIYDVDADSIMRWIGAV